MKLPIRLGKAVSFLGGISLLGVSIAHSHPLPETDTKTQQSHQIEDMKKRQNAQSLKIQKRRAESDARRASIRAKAIERRRLHDQKVIKHKAKLKAEKARRLDFKTQLLDMLVHDGVIESKQQSVKITYRDGHAIANNINLHTRYGNKYNNLWRAYGFILSEDSYINITPHQYEIKEVTEDGASRHYQLSSGGAK